MACSITWSYSPARTCVSYKRKQINNISNYQQDWDSRAIYLKAVGHECWNHVQGQMCIISVILDFLPILLYCKVWTLNFKNNFTKVEIFWWGLTISLEWLTVCAEIAFRSECLPWMVGRQYCCKNKSNGENLDHPMT